jgi:predicted phage terminase large subunit-like protein
VNPLEIARTTKPNYVADWYHELIASYVTRCLDGDADVPNLLVAAPPGSGKSELISILTPAAIYAEQPTRHVIQLCNSDSLAKLMSSNVARVLHHPEYQARWPLTFDRETQGSFTIAGNDGRPSMHSAGIGGQLTGHRADYLLFDDLIKNLADAMSETIREKIKADFAAAAETRLLPEGKVIGIHTRWHDDDPIGFLVRHAMEDSYARQFIYLSLACWNDGEDSFILDTRTKEKTYLPKYKSLAAATRQPYSFSNRQLKSKRADLGPDRFSALYLQQPLAMESQLFPPECWREAPDPLDIDGIQMVVTAWDCASKQGAKNDYSANVVILRLNTGEFVVYDVWKDKVTFAELPAIVMARYHRLVANFSTLPLLVIEDANSGTQLIQLIQADYPALPLMPVKAVHQKIIRAEGVTPITRGGLVSLPLNAPWRDSFVRVMANFPVGEHDDEVDAFTHGLKAFVHRGDFKKLEEGTLVPGRIVSPREQQRAIERAMYLASPLGGGSPLAGIDGEDDDFFDGADVYYPKFPE